jgi:hypothetical protein
MKYDVAWFHYLWHIHHAMKMILTMKQRDLEPQFDALLRGLLGRVPFLKLASLSKDTSVSSGLSCRADLVAQVKAGGRKWTLEVMTQRLGHPREMRSALLQLERNLNQQPRSSSCYGLVLAPFISEESAALCNQAGIGYADLAGNARLSFDQVYIETRGGDNPFKDNRQNRSIFTPKSARVLRELLQGPLRPWKVTELAKSTQVSLGWVSAVRKQLLAHEWASEEQGGLLVTKPGEVLNAWSKADDWEKRTSIQEYSVLVVDPLELAKKLKGALCGERLVFTQWFAGWLRHPYTTPTIVTAYVDKFPDDSVIKAKLLGRRVSSGGGLRLALPKDNGVFSPSQKVHDLELASDVQIYLDLLGVGLRGQEQAEELRQWPDFAGGWG